MRLSCPVTHDQIAFFDLAAVVYLTASLSSTSTQFNTPCYDLGGSLYGFCSAGTNPSDVVSSWETRQTSARWSLHGRITGAYSLRRQRTARLASPSPHSFNTAPAALGSCLVVTKTPLDSSSWTSLTRSTDKLNRGPLYRNPLRLRPSPVRHPKRTSTYNARYLHPAGKADRGRHDRGANRSRRITGGTSSTAHWALIRPSQQAFSSRQLCRTAAIQSHNTSFAVLTADP